MVLSLSTTDICLFNDKFCSLLQLMWSFGIILFTCDIDNNEGRHTLLGPSNVLCRNVNIVCRIRNKYQQISV